MRNKKERLATHLRAFIKQVEHDLSFKEEIFNKYDRLEIPAGYYSPLRKTSEPFKAQEETTLLEEYENEDNLGLPIYDPGNILNNRVISTATLFEHSAWLLCETAAENRMKNHCRRELQQEPDLSSVSKDLKNKALPIFDKWSKKILLESKSIQEMHLNSFWPNEKSTVQTLLIQLNKLIDHPNNIHEVRASESCRNDIIQYLFREMDKKFLNGNVVNHFLKRHGLNLKVEEADSSEEKKFKPLKNKPARRSVSSEKIMKYIKYLANWFYWIL